MGDFRWNEFYHDLELEKARRYFFPILLLLLQILFIILFGVHSEYNLRPRYPNGSIIIQSFDEPPERGDVDTFYPMFQDVHVMMFIGFGFLMTFLRRYSFSAVCFNFLIAAFVLEWAIIIRGYVFDWNLSRHVFGVDVQSLIHADFVCAAVLISFGAVLGKTNPAQLIVLALFEVVIQVWNEWIGSTLFCAYDAGESVYVHIFGAYFGLAVAFVLHKADVLESAKEGSSYASDIFSMVGTLFLFCFWPSFNAGTAYGDGRLRAVTNTYISICSSVLCTFILSAFLGKGKKEIIHIQNATLAGGVAVGCVADKNIGLFGAMIIGSLAGTISTVGYKHLLERLKKLHIHDTCGVHNLHGMPGVLSGFAGIVVASMPQRSLYKEGLSEQCFGGGLNRSVRIQAAYQAAAVFLTLGLAIVGGLLTGLFLRLPIFNTPDQDTYFDDSLNWIVPDDFVDAETSAIGKLAKQLKMNMPQLNEEDMPPAEIDDGMHLTIDVPNQQGKIRISLPFMQANEINEINELSRRPSANRHPSSIRSPHSGAHTALSLPPQLSSSTIHKLSPHMTHVARF
ncbi:unnamed protein product [Didymodactylos carnosus]|uniref:Ammonium transporter AmtB-like domain-containing protein n=1 Tax=Didymodactylos carnosus TaxID=1234261 RepID=A0A815U6M7_9BILA|nr:unnamed protein product [Didymodactylos carnosus]CAF1515604.1 unnamed protein product [Didymodactylos carnosus]CAF4096532.1 unnamed protein product [Didymodactylos carnosus]CAF4375625.1 unnamed protein product [Didymodactylos carnosus]